MARTPEPEGPRLRSTSPFLSAMKIPQDQQTPRNAYFVADDNEAFMDYLSASSERLSDGHLAFRKANETAARRSLAASWLQKMVGPLELPSNPSEEELRLCLRNGLVLCNLMNKIHPGAVLKIVENPGLTSPPPQGAALSAYQYFENVRNFLVAVEELKLPSFQASDLEKGSLQSGSSAKVVDCILALKAYHEWQLKGGQGLWRFSGGAYKSPCSLKSLCRSSTAKSSDCNRSKTSNQIPRPRIVSGFDGPKSLFKDWNTIDGEEGETKEGINYCEDSGFTCSDVNAAWIQNVGRRFDDALSMKGLRPSELDSISSDSLLKLLVIALRGKRPEEVPMFVEIMLKKVIEEFEQRLARQQCSRPDIESSDSSIEDRVEEQSELQALQMELDRFRAVSKKQAQMLSMQQKELQGLKHILDITKLEVHNMRSECNKDMENLDSTVQHLAQAATKYHKVLAENRELYNQVQDLKGNIRVFCRVRPFHPDQIGNRSTIDYIGEDGSIVIANPLKVGKDQRKSFTFNRVFNPSAAQEEVFLDTQPLIRSVLDGFNVCIFAYGQTGSGKTHTMTGPNNPSPSDWGVNLRALNDLFHISQSRKDHMTYGIGVQMIEIYNEQVKDLLSTDGSNKRLEIRNNSQQNGLNVPDASMMSVNCTQDVLDLMSLGHKNRAVGSTALNERSSRSHSVLTVHVKGIDQVSGAILRGCLHLVDLAGSERVDKSEATGDRLKEAQHINKSLSALGDVIAALAQKNSHVPYRNSKLTQLLQGSLGGQAKTLMFVHISPDEESYSETLSTLKFAERVASVELGAAHSNKESGEIRDLKDQVAFLKDSLAKRDAEVERFQKELKHKPLEYTQERSKGRTTESPCPMHLHSQKIGLDAVQVLGKQRQPLEEVRNVEVRHSSANISHGPLKRLSSSGLNPVDFQYMGANTCNEDDVKRRANKEGKFISSSEQDSSYYIQCVNTSKIRNENSSEAETMSFMQTPQDRRGGGTETCGNSDCQNEATPTSRSSHDGGQASASFSCSGRKDTKGMTRIGTSTSSTASACSLDVTMSKIRQSHLKPSKQSDGISVKPCLRGLPTDESVSAASSPFTDEAEAWPKVVTGSLVFTHGAKNTRAKKGGENKR
ncbi:hypothetical protein KP509_26G041000 [Ceratopteris richardii]|nr:hypothetical protein KP509_26G041000 [Ceratopteris richardii]